MTKEFGWIQVLSGISFTLPQNQSIGILGRNGAGKSTLMRILSGMDIPDSGTVDIGNARLSWPLGANAGLHGSLTGRENIKFICRIYDEDFDLVFNKVEEFAELKEYMHMPIKTYSSGMKSRLAFGISMAINFDTYLIDEGFSAGDARFRAKTKVIFAEKRKTANIIVVSHNPNIIRDYCDIAGILENGKLTIVNDLNEAIKIYQSL